MFERRHQPVLHPRLFLRRLMCNTLLALGVIAASLFAGMLGYHFIAHLGWVDSFLNASMILSGMGPVNELQSPAAKIFAGSYALFSGIVFISTAAILFAPLLHRMMHRFHLPTDTDEAKSD